MSSCQLWLKSCCLTALLFPYFARLSGIMSLFGINTSGIMSLSEVSMIAYAAPVDIPEPAPTPAPAAPKKKTATKKKKGCC